jgi:hypothetical protein
MISSNLYYALAVEPLLEFFFMECNGIKKTTGENATRFASAKRGMPKFL